VAVSVRADEVDLRDARERIPVDRDGEVVEDAEAAEVDIRDVDDLGVAVLVPQVGDDLREELEGAACPLEVRDAPEALVEDPDDFGVERVSRSVCRPCRADRRARLGRRVWRPAGGSSRRTPRSAVRRTWPAPMRSNGRCRSSNRSCVSTCMTALSVQDQRREHQVGAGVVIADMIGTSSRNVVRRRAQRAA